MKSTKYFQIGMILCREHPELAQRIADGIITNFEKLNTNVSNLYTEFQQHDANEDPDRLYIFTYAACHLYNQYGNKTAVAKAIKRSPKTVYHMIPIAKFRYQHVDNFKYLTDNFLNTINDGL